MSTEGRERVESAARAALVALQNRRRDEARLLFGKALDLCDEIADEVVRREALGPLALLLDRVGFPDLGLIAAEEAVALGEALGDRRALAEDLVSQGNCLLHLGETARAEACYRRALALCLENGDLDNAASASTNIAIIIGNDGRMDEAIRMMFRSLEYLACKANVATEIVTRIALTQALEAELRDPDEIFAVAQPVAAYADALRPDQWSGLREPLERTIRRYVAMHPGADPQRVKADKLGGLYR